MISWLCSLLISSSSFLNSLSLIRLAIRALSDSFSLIRLAFFTLRTIFSRSFSSISLRSLFIWWLWDSPILSSRCLKPASPLVPGGPLLSACSMLSITIGLRGRPRILPFLVTGCLVNRWFMSLVFRVRFVKFLFSFEANVVLFSVSSDEEWTSWSLSSRCLRFTYRRLVGVRLLSGEWLVAWLVGLGFASLRPL